MGSYCCADKGYEYLLIDSCSKEVVSQPSKDDVSRVAVERSEYLKLLEIYPNVCENPESLSLFKDAEFPPSSESFGDMFPEQTVAWQRLRTIAPGRAFCSGQAEMGGYFLHQKYQNDVLSAIAAVAEQPARIRRLFPSLEANESGLYMVRLMREGLVREIVVDDFIPVFKEHCTFFVRATAGECWPLILEKGLAKLCGSYQRAMQSSLGDLLRALTFSPVQSVSTALPPDQLWELMREGRRKDYVVCATSGEQSDQLLGPEQTFTVVACEECVFRDGVRHRLVKLRNAFNPERNWKGPFSSSDEAFWANPEAGSIFQGMSKDKKGYFVLPFEEFSQRMQSLHVAEVEERLSQHSLTLHSSVNRASYFSVVLREMTKLRVTVSQPRTDGISELAAGPVRLVVARRQEEAGLPLQYCGSAYGRGYDVTATVEAAQEGLYVLYAKAGCDKPTLLLESRGQVQLEQTGKVPGFLESVFQHHAQLSARKLPFRDSRDWVCSELLLREAGLGYFASYVAEDSPRSVKVSYSLASLREGLMVLKGEQAEQQLEHTFGRGRGIILAKVQWELERAARVYKFPPQDMLVESQVETD